MTGVHSASRVMVRFHLLQLCLISTRAQRLSIPKETGSFIHYFVLVAFWQFLWITDIRLDDIGTTMALTSSRFRCEPVVLAKRSL